MGRRTWVAVTGLLLLGCGSDNTGSSGRPSGTEGGACFTNGTCNAGLSCLSKLCVDAQKLVDGSGGVANGGDDGGVVLKGGSTSIGSGGASAGASNSGGDGGVFASGGAAGAIARTTYCPLTATTVSTGTAPVDMYIMFDQSSSMGDPLPDNTDTWWGAAQKAVTQFVDDTRASGIGVGIQYFPLGGVAPASCTADYSTPEIEIALLPGNAAAIAASVQKHQPTAFTPTAPALSGAIDHMTSWGALHPDRAPAVVLVTDGFPTECDPQQITDIATIAATGFKGTPSVRTFVVGFNLGAAGENLAEIAKAGGTGAPVLINSGSIGDQFTSALLGFGAMGTGSACAFSIPASWEPTQLEILNADPTDASAHAKLLGSAADCAAFQDQGYFYDNPAKPTKIITCAYTCTLLTAHNIEFIAPCGS